jgi:hypothetical protein
MQLIAVDAAPRWPTSSAGTRMQRDGDT